MTSRRATPAPVAPPNSNQSRIDINHVTHSPVRRLGQPQDDLPSPTGNLSFIYRRSQSPNINVQINKRNIISPQRTPEPSDRSPIHQQHYSYFEHQNKQPFNTQQQRQQQRQQPQQQQQQNTKCSQQIYHVITPPVSPSIGNPSINSTVYGRQNQSSGSNSQTISVQCSSPNSAIHSKIPIMISPDGSTRIRQRLIIAPENSPPPSGLTQITRANLAATVTSAARRRSLSSRSSPRSSISEECRDTILYSSSRDKTSPLSLPIRRLSSTSSTTSPFGSPVNDVRYNEVAPPESFWSNQSSHRVIVPGSLSLSDKSCNSSARSSPSQTPNKLRGLHYDTIPAKQSGPSSAERKLAALTSAIEKDLELNIPIKSSKVTRNVSNGSLNSISDKSCSSQTSPSSRSDEEHPLIDRLNEDVAFISRVVKNQYSQDTSYGECNKCGEEVYGENNACEAMELIYHVKCFTCDECRRTLRDKAFYTVNGKVYCEEDYKYSGFQQDNEKCATCGHLIMDMQVLHAHNKTYHPSCFRCKACNVPLNCNPFITDKSNRVFCVKDYYRLHSPVCNYCRRTIEPFRDTNETVKVVSLNRDYHVDCFHCHDCNLQLTSEENKICYPNKDGSRLYCGLCVANHKEIIEYNENTDVKQNSCQLVISKNIPPQTLAGNTTSRSSSVTNL